MYNLKMIHIAEYIWIDIDNNTRSKARTLYLNKSFENLNLDDIPEWNFDGSSTAQAVGNDSEVVLKPKAIYKDPVRNLTHKLTTNLLVLCDCYNKYDLPLKTNTRKIANEIFQKTKIKDSNVWFGLEQEYVFIDLNTNKLLGWNGLSSSSTITTNLENQNKYYCGVGADRSFGRKIVEEHYNACIEAGLKISGINEEVLPGQWEFQIGPCEGIECADQLWIARYLLHRVSENHNVIASFDPKPVKGEFNGSGLHCNVSTNIMRQENGIHKIYESMYKLKENHNELIKYCGNNSERLTGKNETSKMDSFTFGVGDRTASVRIPNNVDKEKCGYFEYRVPASDADPYLVTANIAKIICLD